MLGLWPHAQELHLCCPQSFQGEAIMTERDERGVHQLHWYMALPTGSHMGPIIQVFSSLSKLKLVYLPNSMDPGSSRILV